MAAPSHAMKINGVCQVFWTTKMVHLCPLMANTIVFVCFFAHLIAPFLFWRIYVKNDKFRLTQYFIFFFVWKRAAKTLLNKMYLCVMEESKSHRIGMTCRQTNDPRIRIFGYITSSKPFIVHFLWDFGSLKSRTFFQLFVPTKIRPVFVVTHIWAKPQGKTPPQN